MSGHQQVQKNAELRLSKLEAAINPQEFITVILHDFNAEYDPNLTAVENHELWLKSSKPTIIKIPLLGFLLSLIHI